MLKIAVLGGGPAALAAVFGLTSAENAKAKFDITVYQMGWRLGGKCASKRFSKPPSRNTEHGLHVLGGFYHNTMHMMRECYEEWQLVGQPSLAWDEAFKLHNVVHLMERRNGAWEAVHIPLPDNNKQPGIGYTELTPWALIKEIFDWVFRRLSSDGFPPSQPAMMPAHKDSPHDQQSITAKMLALLNELGRLMPPAEPTHLNPDEINAIVAKVDQILTVLKSVRGTPSVNEPDYRTLMEIGFVCFRGIVADGVWRKGFDAINDDELLAWFQRHGAQNSTLLSPYARAGYDYLFAYIGGETWNPSLAAGVGLRGLLRMLATYHGAMFVHMLGGMGEVIFTPLFEVLKSRGVKFEFFHRVDSVVPDIEGKFIEQITMTRQAKLAAGVSEYDPLVRRGDRMSWPEHPRYELLDTPVKVTDNAEDIWETPWDDPDGSAAVVLRRGPNFDLAILGISVGALEDICDSLAQRFDLWRQMLSTQRTIRTIGAQFWLSECLPELGWPAQPTVLTAFQEPLATWADMTFLLEFEGPNNAAKSLAYLCGPMTSANVAPIGAPPFRVRERQRAQNIVTDWMTSCIGALWPNAVDTNGQLKKGLVVESYIQANDFPSDTYVLSPPGTIMSRLRADYTGLSNLYVVGDWVRTGTDSGCVETAVIAGFQCSRAIGEWPAYIPGETDFPQGP